MRTQGNLWTTLMMLIRGIIKGKQICFIGKDVKIGRNVKISPLVLIDDNVVIKDNVFFGYGCVIREFNWIDNDCSFGHLTVIESDCRIGRRVSFHAQCHITRGTVIEDDVFVAPFYLGLNTKTIDHGRNLNPPIEAPFIKRAARIGAGVIITPGVTIGENAFIGAGSIVTKNVPEREMWVGNPAKKVGNVKEEEIL